MDPLGEALTVLWGSDWATEALCIKRLKTAKPSRIERTTSRSKVLCGKLRRKKKQTEHRPKAPG